VGGCREGEEEGLLHAADPDGPLAAPQLRTTTVLLDELPASSPEGRSSPSPR